MKNKNIEISELGKEGTFVSGNKYWNIEWAEISGERFSVGDKVSYFEDDENYFEEDDRKKYVGKIEWMIFIDDESVEVSIPTVSGRIDLESLKHEL